MKRSTTIPYVALDPGRPGPVAASFLFVRWTGVTFVYPPSDPPHRHAFHELLLVEAGRIRHTVDGETIDLAPRTLALVARGQVHAFDRAIGVTGWQLRFAEEFLPAEADPAVFARPGTASALALRPTDLRALAEVADLLGAEYALPAGGEPDGALRHLLALLLLRVGRIHRAAANAGPAAREEQRIYRDFVALLERDFAAYHGVAHYAAALGLDPARLSTVLSRVLGTPTKRAIDERLVLEAKRLLRHTALSLKEVAVELGYADQFHLSKVFKRLVRLSPREYRRLEKLT